MRPPSDHVAGARLAPLLLLGGCLWISPADHAVRLDGDGDGALGDVDCNDADPEIGPGRAEIPCDGVDNDCDPATPDGPAFVQGGGAYATVQEAIDAALPPQEVVVCPGTASGPLTVATPGLTVSGAGTVDATGYDGAAITVTAAGVTLADLVVRGGAGCPTPPPGGAPGRYGGAICAVGAGPLTLRDVSVTGARPTSAAPSPATT
ncbi:MAG: putative metal-binding motif-containing protein [Myxococcota bacterium]